MLPVRRSLHDREILRPAVPALGALALWTGARYVGMAARYAGSGWEVTGAVRTV